MNESVRQPVYEFERFRLDAQRRVLFGADGHPISLTPRLFDMLLYLVEHAGQLLTKEQLLEALWPNVVVEEHNLNKTISELRRVLGEKPGEHRFIVTKAGRGYRFVAHVSITGDRETLPETPGTPTSAEPDRRRPTNLWRVGTIGVVALLATAVGFAVFDDWIPRSDQRLRARPLVYEKDGGEILHLSADTVWKPDSQAIAFSASPNRSAPEAPQPYVLYLDGASPQPLAELAGGLPKLWTPTGQVLLSTSEDPTIPFSQSTGLWTVPAIGGEPELVFTPPGLTTNLFLAITADGLTLAALRPDERALWGIWAGSIASGTLERYEPIPFAPKGFVNVPRLSFSPDGRRLLLMWNPSAAGEQAWLLPYPPDKADPPRLVLEALPRSGGTPRFSWLPDNRHIVVSTAEPGQPRRLYLADTDSGRFRPLSDSTSTTHQDGPAVSPDGARLVFTEIAPNLDIVTMNVHTANVSTLIATNRTEQMPAWAADANRFVYVTDRNGQPEIWVHENDDEWPVVTPHHFPSGTTASLMAPTLSPDGTRVMYSRVESDARGGSAGAHLWMSSLSGGAPMRLRDRLGRETSGSWSPDGAWFAYEEVGPEGRVLKKARTSGNSEPETLVDRYSGGPRLVPFVPVWSPDGRWILFEDDGLKMVAADGSEPRDFGVHSLCTFARAEELMYCIDVSPERATLVARSFDGTVRVVGPVAWENRPAASSMPSLRLTLTPDGQGVTYAVDTTHVQLLLAEGLADVVRP